MSAREGRVSATFRLERDELREALWTLARPLRFGLVNAVLLAILVVVILFARGKDGFRQAVGSPVPAAIVVGVSLLALAALHLTVRWNAKRAHAKLPPGDVRMALGPDGVSMEDGYGRAQLPWSHFEKGRETDGLFLLSPTGGTAHVLPKRALSLDELRQARAMLRERGLLR